MSWIADQGIRAVVWDIITYTRGESPSPQTWTGRSRSIRAGGHNPQLSLIITPLTHFFQAKNGVCDDGRIIPDLNTLTPPIQARNGVCDDGRAPSLEKASVVFCDLGTDCEDCGPWEPKGAPQW